MGVELPRGTRLAGLTIIDKIGQGGFGITYRARNGAGEMVALKEYFPVDFATRLADHTVRPTASARRQFARGLQAFMNEANTLKGLPRQSGLVRVRGAFEKFGTAFCIMDFIEGETLGTLYSRQLRLNVELEETEMRSMLLPVCDALAAVHSTGLVHRDVKPANVMIRRHDHQPVLIDFGAAQRIGRSGPQGAMFTHKYAPIEFFAQIGGGARALREGPWSDIYSLSIMFYEMVAERAPVSATERWDARAAGRADPHVPLGTALARRRRLERYSPAFIAAIEAGCTLDPGARPRTIEGFLDMLGDTRGPVVSPFSGPAGDPATLPHPAPAAVPDAARGRRTGLSPQMRRTIATVGAVALIAAAAAGLGLLSGRGGRLH